MTPPATTRMTGAHSESPRPAEAPAIELTGVCFAYDRIPVMDGVSLSIRQGDFVSVIGPNGGGKTTLLKLLLGLLAPASGSIRILGMPATQARRWVGYMPQYTNLDQKFPATVLDVVLMGRLGRGGLFGFYRRADRNLALASLERVKLAGTEHRPFASLSGGQKQRVLIARALACEPKLLLLDEPTSNLDMGVQDDFYQLLHQINRDMTVLLVSHDVGFVAQMVNTVVCVDAQHHVFEVHAASRLSGDTIREMYGKDVRMVRHDHAHEGHHHHSHGDHDDHSGHAHHHH